MVLRGWGSAVPAGVDASGSGHSKGTQSGSNGGHMYPSEPSACSCLPLHKRQTASLSKSKGTRAQITALGVTSLYAFSPNTLHISIRFCCSSCRRCKGIPTERTQRSRNTDWSVTHTRAHTASVDTGCRGLSWLLSCGGWSIGDRSVPARPARHTAHRHNAMARHLPKLPTFLRLVFSIPYYPTCNSDIM
jgi:hypothetical protein